MNRELKLRLLSAFGLIGGLAVILLLGRLTVILAIIAMALLFNDEILLTFIKMERFSKEYKKAQYQLLAYFLAILLAGAFLPLYGMAMLVALAVDGFLIHYLFYGRIREKNCLKYLSISYVPSLFIFTYSAVLLSFLRLTHWREHLIALLVINYSIDAGAWFIGSRFGKNKLWPEISPKKTWEGSIGGLVAAFLFGVPILQLFFKQGFSFKSWILILCLAIISQLGDLVQSAIKRAFQVKDSSSLIPGHGGVYDRVDSLIFSAPFYILLISLFSL